MIRVYPLHLRSPQNYFEYLQFGVQNYNIVIFG